MKQFFTFLCSLLPIVVFAQPAGYYSPAAGTTGQPLRTALCSIIRPHTALTYTPGLWNAYYTTDVKPDGKLWDVYSDVPGGTPAYEFTLGANQCGGNSPSAEGGCYNREHIWPQSKYGSAAPMETDLFIVYPTDYLVNNRRGDYPYGQVTTATQTFTNGSKIGTNTYPGAPAGSCFEPVDSFKGDLARTYFYISTCYKNDSAAFTTWEMATQANLTPWTIQMLLDWHHNDPVSKKEVDRNNAVYALQNNRNPFIDHPEYADCIWGTGDCRALKTPQITLLKNNFSMYPNPTTITVTIKWASHTSNEDVQIDIMDHTGRVVYTHCDRSGNADLLVHIANWSKGIYLVRVVTSAGVATQKLTVQ